MKKRLFRKILQKLLSLHAKGLKGHALKRVKKLAGLICGMMRKKKSTMSAVGSGLPQQITAHSKEKACKDFLDNAWNDYDTHYLMAAYDKRYAIECLFKDLKSTSFNIHKTRLKSALAISNLIMVAAFAFTLLIKLATKYEQHEMRKFLHRIRPDRIVCSIFFYALELIDYFLYEDIEFDFHLSKFSMNFP